MVFSPIQYIQPRLQVYSLHKCCSPVIMLGVSRSFSTRVSNHHVETDISSKGLSVPIVKSVYSVSTRRENHLENPSVGMDS